MMGRSLPCWPADSTVFQAKVQLLKGPIKPSPAQPSPALLKQDFICRGPCHGQVVWEEFHLQNEVQMLFSKSIF